MTAESLTIRQQIEAIVKPLWDALVTEHPEVITEHEYSFEEMCDEVELGLP